MKHILLLLVLLASFITLSQKTQSELLDELFTSLSTKNSFNGNVLVAESGTVIFEKSYGLANEETKQKLNLQTKFELASVSKQFTAMGIVLLEKQGKLNYDDDISNYIPELSFYDTISIRNLLNHTSGLPDYMDLFEENWDKSKFVTNEDIVLEFAKHKPELLFLPNEQFDYSNTGYALLGLIIERASHLYFEQFLTKYIFEPLKMSNTFVYRSRFSPKTIDNYALGYVNDDHGKKCLTDSFGKEYYSYYLDGIVGDGMVNSTLEDLLKWDRALYSNSLVNEEDKNLIFSSGTLSNGEKTDYGFGWFILENAKYGKIVNHSGGWAGYTTYIERHLDMDKTIIFLQNNSIPSTKIPVKNVRKILYKEPILHEKPIALKAKDLKKYVGVYSNEEFPVKLTISIIDAALYAQAEGQSAIPLEAFENHTFKFDPADITLIFTPEEGVLELLQGDKNLIFKR